MKEQEPSEKKEIECVGKTIRVKTWEEFQKTEVYGDIATEGKIENVSLNENGI